MINLRILIPNIRSPIVYVFRLFLSLKYFKTFRLVFLLYFIWNLSISDLSSTTQLWQNIIYCLGQGKPISFKRLKDAAASFGEQGVLISGKSPRVTELQNIC